MLRKFTLTAIALAILAGCTDSETFSAKGQFVDAPVAGMSYVGSTGVSGTTDAQGYFNCLKSYLHHDDYGVQQPEAGSVVLKEKIHKAQGQRPKEYKVSLRYEGEVIVIKLDRHKDRLFHFLDDTAMPWSKR